VGRYYVEGALNAAGRHQVFRLWGHRPDFIPCIECPHKEDKEDEAPLSAFDAGVSEG
jgi:hypothetical protein